jgi:hypothetical protein
MLTFTLCENARPIKYLAEWNDRLRFAVVGHAVNRYILLSNPVDSLTCSGDAT